MSDGRVILEHFVRAKYLYETFSLCLAMIKRNSFSEIATFHSSSFPTEFRASQSQELLQLINVDRVKSFVKSFCRHVGRILVIPSAHASQHKRGIIVWQNPPVKILPHPQGRCEFILFTCVAEVDTTCDAEITHSEHRAFEFVGGLGNNKNYRHTVFVISKIGTFSVP